VQRTCQLLVVLSLSAGIQPAAPARHERSQVEGHGRKRSLRILLAEDDSELRVLLSMVLRADGHHVVEAEDGTGLREAVTAALRQADDHAPATALDLVISDHRMPGVTGLDVLSALHQGERRVPPFILITAFGDAETHARAGRMGALVIDKPFDVATFRRTVARASRR
jgi:CheY-like chemotaxis protein